MKNKFLCIGECMVEMAQIGDGMYRRGFAGDTFNTAWYARRLLDDTWTVGYASAIGTDAISSEMAEFMSAEGIDTATLRAVPDRTVGLYMISIENGERSFSYWRSQSAARQLADDPAWLQASMHDAGIVYFSGITLAILKPEQRKTLCAALMDARRNGARVAFDTNLRPRLWETEEAMRDGIVMGASVADIVLPSFDEEVILFGDKTPAESLRRYQDAGAGIIAVKNGAGALTLWDKDGGERELPSVPVTRMVDSTAAGDSFGAGFVSGIGQGLSPDAAAQNAMTLAAKVIQSRGALVPEIFSGDET